MVRAMGKAAGLCAIESVRREALVKIEIVVMYASILPTYHIYLI
jgi:hypothetical protein